MGNKIRAKQILAIVESQGYRCALSGRHLTPQSASLDHKQPLSRDGEHDITNIQIVDAKVNAAKGTMTNEEFVAMCLEVVEYASVSAYSSRGVGGSLSES